MANKEKLKNLLESEWREWRGGIIETIKNLSKNQDELKADIERLKGRIRDLELNQVNLKTKINLIYASLGTGGLAIILTVIQIIFGV